ncbi:unnamed protein product [Jaminaea pallidilutea]
MASTPQQHRNDVEADAVEEDQPLLQGSDERERSNQPRSGVKGAWDTTVAAFDVYRTELTSRWNAAVSSSKGRGKQRQRDGTDSSNDGTSNAHSQSPYRRPLRIALIVVGSLILLVLALIGIEAAHLSWSTLSSPSEAQQARILDEALVLRGPDSVRLLNISDDGVQVRIDGRLGLDPDLALDIWLGQRRSQSWWKRRDRRVVEWALARVGGVKVELGQLTIAEPDWKLPLEVEEVNLLPSNDTQKKAEVMSMASTQLAPAPPRDLLTFHLDPLLVPLPQLLSTASSPSKPNGDDDDPILGGNSSRRAQLTMRPLNLTLLFKPVSPAPYIVDLGQRVAKQGNVTLDVKVASLNVRGVTHREMAQAGDKALGQPRSSASSSSSSSTSWIPSLISLGQRNMIKRLNQKIPKLDTGNSTSDLLNLTRYDFFPLGSSSSEVDGQMEATAGPKAMGIRAYATAKNPLGSLLKGSVRWSLPFGVFLPVGDVGNSSMSMNKDGPEDVEKVILAAVATKPFELDGQDMIQLELEGRVIPPPVGKPSLPKAIESGSHQQPFALSSNDGVAHTTESPNEIALGNFLSRFLRGDPNTVYVRGGSPFNSSNGQEVDYSLPGSGSANLPSWLGSTLSILDVPIAFPGSPITDLIKNVTIADLKIKTHPWSQEKLLFSGTIWGEMSLPKELSGVDVDIRYLWPDILVYDGKPPGLKHGGGHGDDDPDDGGDDDDDDDDDVDGSHAASRTFKTVANKDDGGDDAPPLPSPLPKGAFGRVRPHTWANASTLWDPSHDPSDPTPPRKMLRSELIDVPFTVLPGRGKEFRSFTWKVVTAGKEGVQTGIEGSSKVRIQASGLGDLEVKQLPVVGVFMVGKRGGDDDGDD